MNAATLSLPGMAKLTPPEPNRAYRRGRLFQRLDGVVRQGGIAWVSAPAGSGKTTLVASYLQARSVPAVWYQLDAADGDVASLFLYLGVAARSHTPDGAEALPVFAAGYLAGLTAFARNYFRRFFTMIQPVRLVVFDDYHHIASDSPAHGVMREALAEVPRGTTVIVISRGDPPPALTRLRTRDDFTLFDREDLRLSAEETIEVGRQRLAGRAPEERVLLGLHERTQGWLAGLVLMLEHKHVADLEAPRHPLVFDYFAGEVLAQSERRLQRFLVMTSLLPRMTSATAQALTGMEDAGDLLADLDRRNFFIVRHPDRQHGDTYEYHPLFRHFLIEQTRKHLAPEELLAAKRQAACLLAQAGEVQASMALLRDTGDWGDLVSLVLKQAPAMLQDGRFQTLTQWIEDIPEAVKAGMPWLDYFLGVCRLPFDPAQARSRLVRAYEGFRQRASARGEYLAWACIIDTFIYAWSDFRPADAWIDEFDALRSRHPQFPSRDIEVRTTAAIFSILMYRRPQHPDLREWAERIDALLSQDIDPMLRMMAANHLVLYYDWWTGRVSRANELARRVEPFAGAQAVGPFVRIAWEGILAISHWMNAENEAALAAVDRGLALAEATGAHVWDFILMGQGAIAAGTSGDTDRMRAFLRRMQARPADERRLDGVQYHFLRVQEAAQRADVAEMLEHGQAGVASAVDAGVIWGECYTRPALAHGLFLAGDEAGARRELDTARRIGAEIGCSNVSYYAYELEAQFADAQGRTEELLAALRGLFGVMREQGFVNSAWWRSAVMARLCRIALAHGIETGFVQHLIRLRGLQPEGRDLNLEQWPWPLRLRTLGGFEIEIDGETLRFAGKVQKRPLELLKALVALGGRAVSESQLSEALWPDADGDDAHNAFVTTLQRLRKLLGNRDALLLKEGRLSLNPNRCWLDSWALDSLPAQGASAEDLERAIGLYRGGFLAAEEAFWAIPARERLRARFVRAACSLAELRAGRGAWQEAAAGLEQALAADDTVEEFYQQLMTCQARLGHTSVVLDTYRRCRQVLDATLRRQPSAATEALVKELAAARPRS